jgi:pyrroline-5-carboxylate reductase
MALPIKAAAPVLLVGCGKMGSALLQGWLEQGLEPSDVFIVEPYADSLQSFRAKGVTIVGAQNELPAELQPSTLILAVKPQMMDEAAATYRSTLQSRTLVVSIAAGKTITYFENIFGADCPIIRVMPNTPAAIGKGISVLCANDHVSDEQKASAEHLMSAVGLTDWIDDEDLINPVTALSGGGPAYVFLLIETMTEAGVQAGLSRELSGRLALHTVAGAGALAEAADEEPAQLRKNVTSPAGTTLEALNVLMADGGLEPLMIKAIQAATDRSRELA